MIYHLIATEFKLFLSPTEWRKLDGLAQVWRVYEQQMNGFVT